MKKTNKLLLTASLIAVIAVSCGSAEDEDKNSDGVSGPSILPNIGASIESLEKALENPAAATQTTTSSLSIANSAIDFAVAGKQDQHGEPDITVPIEHDMDPTGECISLTDITGMGQKTPLAIVKVARKAFDCLYAQNYGFVEDFVADLTPEQYDPTQAPTAKVIGEAGHQVSYQYAADEDSGNNYLTLANNSPIVVPENTSIGQAKSDFLHRTAVSWNTEKNLVQLYEDQVQSQYALGFPENLEFRTFTYTDFTASKNGDSFMVDYSMGASQMQGAEPAVKPFFSFIVKIAYDADSGYFNIDIMKEEIVIAEIEGVESEQTSADSFTLNVKGNVKAVSAVIHYYSNAEMSVDSPAAEALYVCGDSFEDLSETIDGQPCASKYDTANIDAGYKESTDMVEYDSTSASGYDGTNVPAPPYNDQLQNGFCQVPDAPTSVSTDHTGLIPPHSSM